MAEADHNEGAVEHLEERLAAVQAEVDGAENVKELSALTTTLFEVVKVRPLTESPVDWPELPELALMGVDREGLFYLDPKPHDAAWLKRDVEIVDDSDPDFVEIAGPSLHRQPLVHSPTPARRWCGRATRKRRSCTGPSSRATA